MIASTVRILMIACLIMMTASPVASQPASLGYRRVGPLIEITGPLPGGSVVLELRSSRNRRISKLSDQSPNNPDPSKTVLSGKEIWFPVVDVEQGSDTEIIARFEQVGPQDRMHWNGNFRKQSQPLREEVVLRGNAEHWENAIYVESTSARMTDFFVRKTIAGVRPWFRCLTEHWSGTITIRRRDRSDEVLAKIEIPAPEYTPPTLDSTLRTSDLLAATSAAVDFLLRSQNQNPTSPTFGGLYLFYDLDAKTFRRSDWIWTWGPAIRFLIEASRIPEIAAAFGRDRLLQAAREMGEASLRFLVLEKTHPASGLVITRFDPTIRYSSGHSGFISPADGYFLAGWGWIPLYEATGDERFLNATTMLLEQTERLLANDKVIEQDFVLASDKWKNWTMDESGFGMEAFAEAFRVTGDPRHQTTGGQYLRSLLDVLGRDDGLWDRTWHRKEPAREDDSWPIAGPSGVPVRVPTNANTRGLSWAMMGLLAAHRLLPEEGHLESASRMAQHLMGAQRPAGHWTFRYDRPEREVGISEKGTAIWSLLLYRLYGETRDERSLEAARKALAWCLKNRYTGPDPLAHSGIVGVSPASGVVYRPWFRLICTYTMAFYGNALLAEMNVRKCGIPVCRN